MGSIPTRSRQRRLAARRVLAALVLGWFLLPAAGLLAQEPGVDTTGAAKGAAALHLGGTRPAADSIRPPVTPMGAFFRSFLVPGWGQAAADQPVRGAFYFGAQASTIYMLLKTQSKLQAAKRAVPADTALVRSRTDQREDWIALAVFWALLSGVDAWVSAQLWDFEPPIVPPPDGGLGVGVKIPVDTGF